MFFRAVKILLIILVSTDTPEQVNLSDSGHFHVRDTWRPLKAKNTKRFFDLKVSIVLLESGDLQILGVDFSCDGYLETGRFSVYRSNLDVQTTIWRQWSEANRKAAILIQMVRVAFLGTPRS